MTVLLRGARLGPYEVQESLGQGGMGTVYKGLDLVLNRLVALKVLHPEFLKDPSFAKRFRREAEIWARLEHPRIIPVYMADIENEIPFLAMKLVGGGSLAEALHKGPLPLEVAGPILADIAAALDYAHSLGIVHRDVKPANVLLDDDGRAYLSDFGIAWVASSEKPFTQSGGVFGTPGYMAPEQARGINPDYRVDIYSLGCLAYEGLTGRPPFEGHTPVDVLMRHITEAPTPPRALAPALPEFVEHAILKALQKDPSQRWPTAAFFVRALLGEVDLGGAQTFSIPGHPVTPTPPPLTPAAAGPGTAPSRAPGFWKTHRRVLFLGSVLGVLLGVAAYINLDRTLAPPPLPPPITIPSPPGPTAEALLTAARQALDEGAYPEALDMTELALRLDRTDVNALAIRDRARRAYEAEQSLGTLEAAPPPSPSAPESP